MIDKDLEFNSSSDLEFSKNGTEFFELTPKKNSKKEKSKSSNIIKMLVLTTTLVATVVTVVVNPFKVFEKRLPEFIKQEVVNYTYDEENYTGTYDLEFSFNINGLSIDSIEMYSNPILIYNYTDDLIEPISKVFNKEEFKVIDENVVSVNYTFDDIYTNYDTSFKITYIDEDEQLIYTTDNIKTGMSQFIMYEVNNNNTITYVKKSDTIDFVITFNDFTYGSFIFKLDSLYISSTNETSISSALINNTLVEIVDGVIEPFEICNNEPIVVKFSMPMPSDGSTEVHVELGGDSYYNNTKLEMNSFAFATTQVIVGESFKINKATINNNNLDLNGMTITNVEFNTFGNNYYKEIDQVVPGQIVYARIKLEGLASVEFSPVIDIYLNDAKISSYEYYDITIYEGDTEEYYEFYFEMPSDDILSSDIVINGFFSEL